MPEADESRANRFADDLLVRAARLYYLQDATQAEVAKALGTSRPTVSRLLAEARSRGIVNIEVRDPGHQGDAELQEQLREALGLLKVWVTPSAGGHPNGPTLAPAVSEALLDADLHRGDAMLVSSGASIYAVSQQDLPPLPGVLMAPTVGGQDDPEVYHQTNEMTRRVAEKCHAQPMFLFAPAMPGPQLHNILVADPSVTPVLHVWRRARCALLSIDAPPVTRSSLTTVLPADDAFLRPAVGVLCSRPFDAQGRPVPFPGSERLIAIELETLRQVPSTIAVAVGASTVRGILVAARAGYVNRLVTDRETAQSLLDATARDEAASIADPDIASAAGGS